MVMIGSNAYVCDFKRMMLKRRGSTNVISMKVADDGDLMSQGEAGLNSHEWQYLKNAFQRAYRDYMAEKELLDG